MQEAELDARDLACPLPVLKAQKRLRAMTTGDRLRVTATDPRAPADFEALCNERGHRLVESSQAEGAFRIVIEKGG